jgi:hypothetical protein
VTSRKPPATPTRGPRYSTIGAASPSTGTLPTSSPPSSPAPPADNTHSEPTTQRRRAITVDLSRSVSVGGTDGRAPSASPTALVGRCSVRSFGAVVSGAYQPSRTNRLATALMRKIATEPFGGCRVRWATAETGPWMSRARLVASWAGSGGHGPVVGTRPTRRCGTRRAHHRHLASTI